MLLVLLGVLLSSLILYMVLLNQDKQLKHIYHAKDIAFMPFLKTMKIIQKTLRRTLMRLYMNYQRAKPNVIIQ